MTPHDHLLDVPGLQIGHADRQGDGALTGVTVVLGPEPGMTVGVDVRGGGPATRELDALTPGSLVDTIDAIVLTGGSAYGLDAAAGVMAWLEQAGRGVPVGAEAHQVVPVVPAAAVFDLGRGGDFAARPDAALGRAAIDAASPRDTRVGPVGAGTGAVVGGLRGGVGSASATLPSGAVVAALLVVNAHGSPLDPDTGELLGHRVGPGDQPSPPDPAIHRQAQRVLADARRPRVEPLNTTIGVVATSAKLDRAEVTRLAVAAQAGLPRALDPVHTLFDGDTLFGAATGSVPLATRPDARVLELAGLHAAAATVVTRAVTSAVLAATSVTTPAGTLHAYRDLYG